MDKGIKSIAVVLKHSAIYPDHEEAVGKLARDMGFEQVIYLLPTTPPSAVAKTDVSTSSLATAEVQLAA